MNMSDTSEPRIKRGPAPSRRIKRGKERAIALKSLRRDFKDRCAYSMQHALRLGGLKCLEVEHFDPRLKKKLFQDYGNLLLASRHCNGAKREVWPKRRDQDAGLRFLNPCVEADYGVQIFEDPDTHEIYGTTPAARWHIRMLDLNAKHLIFERMERTRRLARIKDQLIAIKGCVGTASKLAGEYRELLDTYIPEIPMRAKSSDAQSQITGLSASRQ